LALALALAVAGTTNLGGLENIIKVEAATSTETIEVKEVIDGIEWVFTGTKTNGTVTNTSTTITSDYKVRLGNRGVTVPNKIGGYDVTVLDKILLKILI